MRRQGFSLIELMIVVAIMAFLATLAIPNFMRFLAKAKRAEAYMNLHSIYATEKAYYAEHGSYSAVLSGQGGIGWKPEGYNGGGKNEKFYYTYGFAGAEGSNHFSGKLDGGQEGLARSKADNQGFVAVASGDIDGDGLADIISIDQNNNIMVVQDDLAD
jgi:type IV pilus assembly protein PilA